jgi:2-polyprenyl-6-methoxyphenol hydroxylase-like FAD-dependent oxidoreductase
MTLPADVLVVGAGPTGLAMALQAHDHGVRVRIVGRRPEAFRHSTRGEAARAALRHRAALNGAARAPTSRR